MKIDYSPFEKAIGQLSKSISFLNSKMAEENDDLKEQFRSAVIQAFEFNYELSFKLLRRQLEQIVPNPSELREMAFMDLIRTGFEAGLVKDVPAYRVYRDKRNMTSHTYDSDKADDVVSIIDEFVIEMRYLLAELKKRN